MEELTFFERGALLHKVADLLDKRHDKLAEHLTRESGRIGDPLDPATNIGPLNNEPVVAKLDAHVADGRARGAEVLVGGSRVRGFRPAPSTS